MVTASKNYDAGGAFSDRSERSEGSDKVTPPTGDDKVDPEPPIDSTEEDETFEFE